MAAELGLTERAVDHLLEQGVKAVVIACNTASSVAGARLRSQYPQLPIIAIEPALKPAVINCAGGRVLVLATEATLREEKFASLEHRYEHSCRIYELPAPGLVELVEGGRADSPEAEALLERLLGPLRGKLDALVLGCTHYPFAAPAIRRVLGEGVALLDGGEGTARETRRRLAEAGLLENGVGSVLLENSSPDPALMERSRKLLEI